MILLRLIGAVYFLCTTSAISPPPGWREIHGEVSGGELLELTFFLNIPESKTQALEAAVLARADPVSTLYGQGWISNSEVHAMVAPNPEHIAVVLGYLSGLGASPQPRTPNSDIISVIVPIDVAETMLRADYRSYTHAASNTTLTRTLTFQLPEELSSAVAFVGPTTRFQTRRELIALEKKKGDGPYDNSPYNLRSMYGVGTVYGGVVEENKQAVTAFLGEYYSSRCESEFFRRYLPLGSQDIGLVGDATAGAPGVEAMLDAEYMPALGAKIATEFWGFSGKSPNSPITITDEPFLTFLYTVGNTSDADVPKVFSTSYGEDETLEVPTDYADRINVEFLKAAGRGISMLFASGDSGAASAAYGGCPGDQFVPTWPAGSPYVTAVGGTQGAGLPETAWSSSSGGFSRNFPQPVWQADAVAVFLGKSTAPTSFFNSSGRGYPDIAAQAVDYPVIVEGGLTLSVAGTSCAAPTSGGIIGLLNDARLAANKTTLGFLNPLLYANPAALTDTTSGDQVGCGTVAQPLGFSAVEGWDAVTGLGSLNYERLLEVVMALP